MKPNQRTIEVIVNEVMLSEDEMLIAEAVVAAYSSGHSADTLRMNARIENDLYAFDLAHPGNMIISGLKQASAGNPAHLDIFDLSDEQRQQAGAMLEEYEQTKII